MVPTTKDPRQGDVFGDWKVHMSRSKGKLYYFNTKTNVAAWHDASLPKGWAVLYLSAHDKAYIHLMTNQRQKTRPTSENVDSSVLPSANNSSTLVDLQTSSAKRTADEHTALQTASHPHTKKPRKDDAPRMPLPRFKPKEFSSGFPKAPPKVEAFMDTSQFGEAHERILQQLLRPSMATIWDIGAGCGAATKWFLSHSSLECRTFAIDIFSKSYAAAMYESYGCMETAEAYKKIPKETSLFDIFCANFHKSNLDTENTQTELDPALQAALYDENGYSSRVEPVKSSSQFSILKLIHIGATPELVYIDCDLDYQHLKTLLNLLYEHVMVYFPMCPVAGGGWAVSEGVRRAVTEVATERNLPLHVEQEQVWTFTKRLIRITANTQEDFASGSSALATRTDLAETKEDPSSWVTRIAGLARDGDDVEQLREIVGSHGRKKLATGEWAPDTPTTWIDKSAADKRKFTPLMLMCKFGRFNCVKALVDEFGANVNVQAEKSYYTALIMAAYDGYNDIVQFLLKRGADPKLANKWGENAIRAAERNKKRETVAILRDHIDLLESSVIT